MGAIILEVLRGAVHGCAAGILHLTALEAMGLLLFLHMGCGRNKWQMTAKCNRIWLPKFLRPLLKFSAATECFLGKRFLLNALFFID